MLAISLSKPFYQKLTIHLVKCCGREKKELKIKIFFGKFNIRKTYFEIKDLTRINSVHSL